MSHSVKELINRTTVEACWLIPNLITFCKEDVLSFGLAGIDFFDEVEILKKHCTTRIYFERSREGVYCFVDPRSKQTLAFQANPLTREMMVRLGFKITSHKDGTESFNINEIHVSDYLFMSRNELLAKQGLANVVVNQKANIMKSEDIMKVGENTVGYTPYLFKKLDKEKEATVAPTNTARKL